MAKQKRRVEKVPAHVTKFGEALAPVVEYVSFELNKDSTEAIGLAGLGRYPKAATTAAWWLMDDEDFYIRCTGALIPAFTPGMNPAVLAELWQMEAARRKGATDDMIEPMTNSVASRLVISSVRWARLGGRHKLAGFGVLVDMIERSLKGEDWNNAHVALSALVRYEYPRLEELLSRCERRKGGPDYFVPWVRRLKERDREIIDEADLLANGSPLDGVRVPAKRKKELGLLLKAAAEYEAQERAT